MNVALIGRCGGMVILAMPKDAEIILKRKDFHTDSYTVNCRFEDSVWEKLRSDWLAWKANPKENPSGGAYDYQNLDRIGEPERTMLLNFENVDHVL